MKWTRGTDWRGTFWAWGNYEIFKYGSAGWFVHYIPEPNLPIGERLRSMKDAKFVAVKHAQR